MLISESTTSSSITQFLPEETISALSVLLSSTDTPELCTSACKIADIFDAADLFKDLTSTDIDVRNAKETKLTASFHNNLNLLVQKTWIEKSDETLKEQAVYRIEQFCEVYAQKEYNQCYGGFLTIIEDVVYLMFGMQTKKPDFLEYALRIDPGFGVFWWYVSNLPKTPSENEERSRLLLLLGMYFLANY